MPINHSRLFAGVLGVALLCVGAVLDRCNLTRAAEVSQQPTTRPATTQDAKVEKISLAEFDSMRTKPDTVILDVRTPREFAQGHVPGAVNIDWRSRDFNDKVNKLDKSKRYLVHCLGGVRSAAATRRMSTMDFAQLFDFSGGWSEYQKAGKEVEK